MSPTSPGGLSFTRRGHGRHASLGTTMTSPSTRRRSLESTISLIKESLDGGGSQDRELEKLAEQLSSPTKETKELAKSNGSR